MDIDRLRALGVVPARIRRLRPRRPGPARVASPSGPRPAPRVVPGPGERRVGPRPARRGAPGRARLAAAIGISLGLSLVAGPPGQAASTTAGGLVVTVTDPTGSPVGGACIELWTAAAGGGRDVRQPTLAVCDAAPPAAPGLEKVTHDGIADGTLGLADVPIGDYVLAVSRPADAPGGAVAIADVPVTIRAGRLTSVALAETSARTAVVRTVDAAGAPVAGACYRLAVPQAEVQCDGPGIPSVGPGDGRADGLVVLGGADHKAGGHPLEQVAAPPGYARAATRMITLLPDGVVEVTVVMGVGTGGGLVVTNADVAGSPLGGACIELWTATAAGTRGTPVTDTGTCDAPPPAAVGFEKLAHDGLADGTLGIADIPPGTYLVVERRQPFDAGAPVVPLGDTTITIRAGRLTRLGLERTRAASLTVTVVDGAGSPLAGACFQLGQDDDRIRPAVRACDGVRPEGDGIADGIVVLTLAEGDKPGLRPLRETTAPTGYAPVADRDVSVDADGSALTITHRSATGAGGLVAAITDPTGQPVGDACVELWTIAAGGGRGTRVIGAATCDAAPPGRVGVEKIEHDGIADGTAGIADIVAGDYVLVTVRAPSDAAGQFPRFPDTAVTIRSGRLTRIQLVASRPGTVLVRKVDEAGEPLPGACFRLGADREGQVRCDGPGGPGLGPGDGVADGLLVLGDPAVHKPGPLPLTETVAPPGYSLAGATTVTLLADRGAEVTVANEVGAGQPAGGGGGSDLVPSLEFEIDSSIAIRTLSAMAVPKGLATARGRIPLQGDATSGRWRGTGELAAVTTSSASGATCPSLAISGEGTYDWQVREVRAAPGDRADRISVDMDSGVVVEQPDRFVVDTCAEPSDGTMNTWENLFFIIHGSEFGAMGFRVDDWTLVDEAAWTTGGVLAEATWSGQCPSAQLMDCDAATTFRLRVVLVPGSGPAPSPGDVGGGAAPGASAGGAGAIDASTPRPAPSADGAPTIDPPLAAGACTDVVSCAPWLPVLAVAGVVALLVGGSALLLRSRIVRTETLDVPGSTVDYAKVDIEKIASVDLAAAGNDVPLSELELSGDKVAPAGLGGTIKLDETLVGKLGDIKLADPSPGETSLGDKLDPLP